MKKMLVLLGIVLIFMAVILLGHGRSESGGIEEMPFVSEDISRPLGETTVYATITRPEGGKKHPAVVFLPGSGPTDRDWNSPLLPGTNGSAKLLAEELAKNGFVTIRYDKRFAGPHGRENMPKLIGKLSMESHREELQTVVDALAARSDVDGGRIFALANSEGTLHAVNYQLHGERNRFAGMILTGAPGRAVGDLARSQIAAQLQGLPNAARILELYDKAVKEFLETGAADPDPSLPDGIKMLIKSLANPAGLPFTQELWYADLSKKLRDVDVPVLILIGRKDIQIDWQIDGGILQTAARGRTNIGFAFPEDANHVLKHEPNPRDQVNRAKPNYNEEGTELDPGALDIMIRWLREETRS